MRLLILFLLTALLFGQILEKDTLVLERYSVEQLPVPLEKPLMTPPHYQIEVPPDTLPYTPPEIAFLPEVAPLKVKVLDVPKQRWEPLYPRFAKLGFGRFFTGFTQIQWHNGRDLHKHFGFSYENRYTFQGHLPAARFGHHNLTAYYQRFFDQQKFYSQLSYALHRTHYYAIAQEPIDLKTLRNQWNTLFLNIGFAHYPDTQKLYYDFPLQVYGYKDRFDNSELGLFLRPYVHFPLPWLGMQAHIQGSLFYAQWQDTIKTYGFHLAPQWQYQYQRWFFQVGPGFYYLQNLVVFFYPIIKVRYDFIPFRLQGGVSLDGNLHFPFRGYWQQSMFYLDSQVVQKPTWQPLQIEGYLQGRIKHFGSRLTLFYHSIAQASLFYTSYEDSAFSGNWGRFQAFYTDVQALGSTLHLYYLRENHFEVGLRWHFRHYFVNVGEQDTFLYRFFGTQSGWLPQLPRNQWDIYLRYQMGKKLWIMTWATYLGRRYMGYKKGIFVYEPAFLNVFLHLRYHFSKYVAFFVEGNNLLNSPYERWWGYKERPLDFLAGIIIQL